MARTTVNRPQKCNVFATMTLIAALVILAQRPDATVQHYAVGGVDRQALIFAPAGKTSKAPVVFGFHGHGGNMRQASRSFQAHVTWPEAIVIYPDGLPTKGKTDPEGKKQGWQQQVGDYEGRDLKFFDAMLEKLKKDYSIDEKRVYAMGHSNGGRFTYLLWAERGDKFAAFGPSGSPGALLVRGAKPRSLFAVAGEKDPIVPYLGQRLTHEAARRLLGTDSSKARKEGYVSYETGKDGLELGLYVHPGGHEYPSEAAKLTVEFFKRH